MDEFERKAKLIEELLDRIKPIPEGAPESVKEATDQERQLLVLQAGFNKMTITELERKLGRGFKIIEGTPKKMPLEYFSKPFGLVNEIVSGSDGADRASWANITLWGADVLHSHKVAQEIYIYSHGGAGKIFLDGKILAFKRGMRVIINPGVVHAAKPLKGKILYFACVSTPAFNPADVYVDPRGREW